MTAKLKFLSILVIILTSLGLSYAQDSSLTHITVHLKDKSDISGTLVLLNSNQLTVIDQADRSMKNIDISKIASIEFIETPNAPISSTVIQPATPSSASMKCGSTPVPVPEVRGFRLGMTWDEYQQIPFGEAHFYGKPDEVGMRHELLSSVQFYFSSDKEKYKGIRMAELTFMDDRLVKLEVSYDHTVQWPNDLEFTAAVAESLKLPKTGWLGHNPTTLICNEFQVETDAGRFGGSRLVISRLGLDQQVERRRQKRDQEKRQTFKP